MSRAVGRESLEIPKFGRESLEMPEKQKANSDPTYIKFT